MELPRVPIQEDILRRICGEYLEMPGLRLKREQAQRLWGLDGRTCAFVLDTLVDNGFLCRDDSGQYGRRSDGALRGPRPMAKAGLEFKAARKRTKSIA
jgi:hypothetical protein